MHEVWNYHVETTDFNDKFSKLVMRKTKDGDYLHAAIFSGACSQACNGIRGKQSEYEQLPMSMTDDPNNCTELIKHCKIENAYIFTLNIQRSLPLYEAQSCNLLAFCQKKFKGEDNRPLFLKQ